ncbi:hypothetical protein [Leptolyngbya sp. GGD]|uniref:hypothetical protein n=1 Tax=Leptolyngbya sp. GGD TaxID=2997907 RepID=UPI00227D4611|nr:hypothetical protein [Leptolyngbya sp. GGD]MCY6493942.1 hypothetical protein [Leptolyngbya sp. GGD]
MFEVWWEHDGISYPEQGWVDFGYVILGWWVSNIIRISMGEEQGNFSFMDGPFSLNFQYQKDNRVFYLTSEDNLVNWSVSLKEVIDALLLFSRSLQVELSNANALKKEQVILQKYVSVLMDALKQHF